MAAAKEVSNKATAGLLVNIASAVALAIGAWFFGSLDDTVKELKNEIGGLRTQITVLSVTQSQVLSFKDQTDTKIEKLEERIRDLEKNH